MTTQQPEALRLANVCSNLTRYSMDAHLIAAELRTQHARIADLEAQLEAIGAGGASGPLIGQPQAMPDLSQLTERGAKAWAGVDAQGLREGFTAADMATVSAQGFMDGVASVSAQAADSVPAVSDLPPLPAPDLRDVGTKPQEIKEFLKGYATEYARTAIAARAPADSVLEDAARYRFLRDGEWRDTDLEPFIRLQLNTLWDAKIDAARKQGEKQ